MSRPVKLLTLILIIGIIGAGTFYFNSFAKDSAQEFKTLAKPVKTLVVNTNKHTIIRSFPGKVRASKRVTLSFEVSGELTDLPITEGMLVKKGQLIAKLDQRTFENNLLAAKAAYTEAKIHLDRQKKLLAEKVVAQSILDSATSQYDTTYAQYHIAEKSLEDTEMHAPFDGIIAKRYVENHTKVVASEDIVSLQDINEIEIVIQVPESIMVYATKDIMNQKLKVRFDAIPHEEFEVSVHEYGLDADSQTQTYDVVLTMPTPKGYNFLPGMTATVTSDYFLHNLETGLNHIWLPPTAIQGEEEGNKSFVFILNKENKAEKKYIEIGMPTELGVQVISGLNNGDRVVIAGSSYLRDGMLLRAL